MFENIAASAPDPILQIIADYAADPRAGKIDLGVGVFKNEAGQTPVLAAVKRAERALLDEQGSKVYLGMQGDVDFGAGVRELVFGEAADQERVVALQSPGGCGGLRLLFEAVALANPAATVWLPEPGWPNHAAIVGGARLAIEYYPYYRVATAQLDFDAMCARLAGLGGGDVVVLHGCCHNPTGASLDGAQWQRLAGLAAARGFLPLVDLAYQGFGVDLDTDAEGVRCLAAAVPEMLVAYSCSKNFGIYRERTGAALALARDAGQAARILGQMMRVARAGYSMPPDHGAAVVSRILGDAALKQLWIDELAAMQGRLAGNRQNLASAFRERLGSDRFDFIGAQQGMFSLLGVTPAQVERLRAEHAVYMTADSRINIAGLGEAQIPAFVDAVAAVL